MPCRVGICIFHDGNDGNDDDDDDKDDKDNWDTLTTRRTQGIRQTLKTDKTLANDLLRAYKTYQTELAAGGDGRPDFVERKTCNWITDTFQVLFGSRLPGGRSMCRWLNRYGGQPI